jgi:hypothetical protein
MRAQTYKTSVKYNELLTKTIIFPKAKFFVCFFVFVSMWRLLLEVAVSHTVLVVLGIVVLGFLPELAQFSLIEWALFGCVNGLVDLLAEDDVGITLSLGGL